MTVRKETLYIVIHCSATKPTQNIGAEEIRHWHVVDNGWREIGYHYIIRRDGIVEKGRPEDEIGAHVKDYNVASLGICMVGGVNDKGKAEANFTPPQWKALSTLVRKMKQKYPKAAICGHRDLSPDLNHDGCITPNEYVKECPSFDVRDWVKREKI